MRCCRRPARRIAAALWAVVLASRPAGFVWWSTPEPWRPQGSTRSIAAEPSALSATPSRRHIAIGTLAAASTPLIGAQPGWAGGRSLFQGYWSDSKNDCGEEEWCKYKINLRLGDNVAFITGKNAQRADFTRSAEIEGKSIALKLGDGEVLKGKFKKEDDDRWIQWEDGSKWTKLDIDLDATPFSSIKPEEGWR